MAPLDPKHMEEFFREHLPTSAPKPPRRGKEPSPEAAAPAKREEKKEETKTAPKAHDNSDAIRSIWGAGDFMRAERERRGITTHAMAKLLGSTSSDSLVRVERGENAIGLRRLWAASKILGVSEQAWEQLAKKLGLPPVYHQRHGADTLSDQLRIAIMNNGDALKQIAERAHVPYHSLVRFMKGEPCLKISGIDRLAKALRLSLTKTK